MTFGATGVGGAFMPATAAQPTAADGSVSVSFTSSTVAGPLNLTASDGASSGTLTVGNNADAPAKYTVTANTVSPVAGTTITLTAQLTDTYGNALTTPGRTVAWTFSGAMAAIVTTPTLTDSSGQATTHATVNTAAGAMTTFTANDGTASGTSPTVTSLAGRYVVSVAPPGTVSVADVLTVTAQLVDGSGANVAQSGISVSLSAAGVGGKRSAPRARR